MRILFLFLFLFFIEKCFCQIHTDTLKNGVIVKEDVRIDLLKAKQKEINEKNNLARGIKGFRINVIITNKKDEAIAAKAKLLKLYPDEKVYMMYQTPYFKVRFGNFKTIEEAEEVKKKLAKYFPGGVFVIPEKIEIIEQ